MKTTTPANPAPASGLLLAMALAGCFGGEDGGTGAPVDPGDTPAGAGKIAPGIYMGDYRGYDPDTSFESELALYGDGAFRFIWIDWNEAAGDFQGTWFQKDSSLHFTGMTESYSNGGLFDSGTAIEDDTNSVRDVTDSSFLRKEWTPLRQKPCWIPYRKKTFAALQPGNYQFETEYAVDSVTTTTARVRIELTGSDYLYRASEDTLEYFQYRAAWFQQGSILVAGTLEARQLDTATGAFGDWVSFPGALLQRTSEVSDTAFSIWSPPQSFLDTGAWEIYRKVP